MFIDFFMQVKILRLSNWEIIHDINGFVCLFTEKKAVQLSRTGGCYIQFWIHYLSKTLGELSNHPRSPYNVGKFLQNKNLKFLRKSFCKFRFILNKGLWVFLHQSFFQKILWILKYFYGNRKTTDNNSTVVLYKFDGFFDQFTLRNFLRLERFEKCAFYLLFVIVISIRTFRAGRVVGIRNTMLRLSSLVL